MRTGLLWNTFRGDIEWFKISAKSFTKFARGWDRAMCRVPCADLKLFAPICHQHGIELSCADEWPGKGFNWHQLQQCYADVIIPDADVIFHIDGDCVFGMPCTPADWLPNGKILMPYTDYEVFLKYPVRMDEQRTFMGLTGQKIDYDRGQYNWKFAVDFALGWNATRECMAWMPIAHHRDVYAKTREIITERFPDQGFDNYVFNARNAHPQTFAEFNTLGAVAHKFFEDRYHWHSIHMNPHPFYGKVIQSWSRGGFDKEHNYLPQVPSGEINTPRKLFNHLGLL